MDELNIVLDDELYEYMKRHSLTEHHTILFTEMISEGKTDKDIFSSAFHRKRAESLKMSQKNYDKNILKPLKPFFDHKYQQLIIWTVEGMNASLNLLLLLAYLDQIQDKQQIIIYYFDNRMRKINEYQTKSDGYSNVYQTLLLKHKKPLEISITPIQKIIPCYLEYQKEENELTSYIKKHITMDTGMLYLEMMARFYLYNLTDGQFIELLHKCKKKNIKF